MLNIIALGAAIKAAVMAFALFMVTVQLFVVFVQSPLQRLNVETASGVASRFTVVPDVNVCNGHDESEVHDMPLLTAPPPVPEKVRLSGMPSGAEQLAEVPPLLILHIQLHGPLPVRADALPVKQRFMEGAMVNACPLLLPQVPLIGVADDVKTPLPAVPA